LLLFRQAVRLRPQSPEAHNNLGMVLAELARYAEAEPCYQEALRLRPGFADAHANFGNAYKEQGRLEEAVASYDIALAYRPDSVSAHWNRALARLQQGNFADGWAEYEWRWQRKQTPMRPFRQPRWDGAPLAGRTILLWMEQGLGDMIQFIRYAALLQEQGGRVVVECPGFLIPLIPLFSTCPGIAQLVAEGSPLPDFDVHAPLMSLPHLCRTTLTSIPATVPYLFANDALVAAWARQLARYEADYRIGITWQGNPHHRHDRYRSIPVQLFAPLGQLPGVRLINLQKGSGIDQLASSGDRFAVIDLLSEQDPAVAFMDTAAIMRNLHLVITVDTAIAHLAGALGVPVWTAIAAIPDWRWLLDRADSPWYPTMRIFRQQEFGNWREVIDRMAAEIRTQPFAYRDVAEWRAGALQLL
jgi:hypothetical protein